MISQLCASATLQILAAEGRIPHLESEDQDWKCWLSHSWAIWAHFLHLKNGVIKLALQSHSEFNQKYSKKYALRLFCILVCMHVHVYICMTRSNADVLA